MARLMFNIFFFFFAFGSWGESAFFFFIADVKYNIGEGDIVLMMRDFFFFEVF